MSDVRFSVDPATLQTAAGHAGSAGSAAARAREQLLPEIAGYAAYRASAVLDLRQLPMAPQLRHCVRRLQRETTNLRELAEWPGLDRHAAARLLNALYLQAGLIVSRSHPAADTDGWF